MRMPDFIESNIEPIIEDWEAFAGRQRPSAVGLNREERRDLAVQILQSVAQDMRISQSEEVRHEKSLGERPLKEPTPVARTARGHAAERLALGFTLNQLVAEYRALRASVVRRWRDEIGEVRGGEVEELTRFNEAIDESLTEAVGWYNSRVEDARILLNGALAHDLRSPLGAILMSAEVLLREENLDGRQIRTALRIRNSATRIKSMISDLLDFTRTRLGTGLPINTSECNMEMILRDVIEERRASHPDATINCEVAGNLNGQWDADRIEQMLGNLVGNAVEHGRNSPVKVVAEGCNREVTVIVHNQGSQIPEDEQAVIFDPLRRATAQSRQGQPAGAGLGLGLYIARQIAEAHDGTIEVSSSPEAGTTFTVRLPREHREAAKVAGFT
jgi:signal transduction histidine kinase